MNKDFNNTSEDSRRVEHGRATRGHDQSLADCEKGTQSSNTVPPTSINNTPTLLLRSSIDSLYVTYQGDLFPSMSERLSRLKRMAQSKLDSEESLAQITLGKHLFEVKGNGRHPFAYILQDAWYRIEISENGTKHTPLVHCKIASEILTTKSTDEIIADLHKVVESLGSIQGATNISRADLCVDFVTSYPISSIQNNEWVTKARDFASHISGREFSGFSIAPSALLSARLYNKTIELKKNPRPYLEDIWRSLGWDGISTVWRLEFQYRRQALRDLKLVTYTDLATNLFGLWEYACTKWLRHTCPVATDKTQSRWPTSEFWQVLQGAKWKGEDYLERVTFKPSRAPADHTLFVNGLAALTSFMAREGYTDAEEGILGYFQAAQDFHNDNAHQTGVDFDNYIHTKVTQKCRAYSTARNQPAGGKMHPDENTQANEYRKRSNGEY